MEEKTIYDLKLHETLKIYHADNEGMHVIRVSGGWIYRIWTTPDFSNRYPISSVFVPYNEEFVRGNTRKSCRTCKFYDRNENTLTNPCRKCNKGFSEWESKE